ncbi:CDP-alcohol phosphatidyltransferase family protein [Motiliproteus coralliicola]|uniref:CDP-alcohol phosphatidyltransferase family protein n=1 Tax=Motiliproteus coralliicola TaxID=2283196 RepID=UPI00140388CB|nr:CDP-alcohol phosphatidyltransferase family protein [Motiliproteus coralliicola]
MTIKELRAVCQPAYKQKIDPLMEWYLLRPFSIYFTWFFVRLGVGPNWVTLMGMLLGCAGSGLLMLGQVGWGVAGAVLIWLGFLFDCVDGEVARYSGKGSLRGTYLDYFVGGVNDMAIMLGLSFYVAQTMGWPLVLVVTAGVAMAYLEKIIGLYAQCVIYRNIRASWDSVEVDEAQSYDDKVWKEMGLWSRLLRVPFETFFRASLILVAFIVGASVGEHQVVAWAWVLILVLGYTLVAKSFYSEFFQDRVGTSMADFIGALKGRV